MTWQAERPALMVESDKQALTKVEFGTRKNYGDDESEEDFGKKATLSKNTNSQKGTNTLNTFDTFKSYEKSDKTRNPKKLNEQSQGSSFISY